MSSTAKNLGQPKKAGPKQVFCLLQSGLAACDWFEWPSPDKCSRLLEPYPRSAAVRADQLDARQFKGLLNDLQGRPPWHGPPCLKQSNCHHPDPRLVSQLLLCPVEKTTGGAALCWREHVDANTRF